jgi:hypothetical protein
MVLRRYNTYEYFDTHQRIGGGFSQIIRLCNYV